MPTPGQRISVTVTIASGASVSNQVSLRDTAIVGFIAPAAWTTAALNIEVSDNESDWVTAGLFDSMGSAVGSWSSLTAAAGYSVDPVAMLPWCYIRFRSGTLASATNQAAARTFTVITRPLA